MRGGAGGGQGRSGKQVKGDGAVVGDEGARLAHADRRQGHVGGQPGGGVEAVKAGGASVVEVGEGGGGGVHMAEGVDQRQLQAGQTGTPGCRRVDFCRVAVAGGAPVEPDVLHKVEIPAPQRQARQRSQRREGCFEERTLGGVVAAGEVEGGEPQAVAAPAQLEADEAAIGGGLEAGHGGAGIKQGAVDGDGHARRAAGWDGGGGGGGGGSAGGVVGGGGERCTGLGLAVARCWVNRLGQGVVRPEKAPLREC